MSRFNGPSPRSGGGVDPKLKYPADADLRRLLRFSAVPVSEISYQLGFSDPAYFSRFFTRRAGMPPSQYRQSGLG